MTTVNNGPTIVPVVNVKPVTISVTSVSGTTTTLNTQKTELDVVSGVGRTGTRGNFWFSGSGLPSTETIIDYDKLETGDLYVNKLDGWIYQLDQSGNWNQVYRQPTFFVGPEPPADTSLIWFQV